MEEISRYVSLLFFSLFSLFSNIEMKMCRLFLKGPPKLFGGHYIVSRSNVFDISDGNGIKIAIRNRSGCQNAVAPKRFEFAYGGTPAVIFGKI